MYKSDKLISLVTGASSGIGAETAIQLSKLSSHVYIVGRNIKNLELVNDKIIANDSECTIVPLDITENDALDNLAKAIIKKNNRIDVLVSCAGIIEQLSPVESISEEQFKKVIELNFLSNFRLIKSFHYLLKNSENGKLVIVSSNRKELGTQYWGIYQPIMRALNELLLTYANENKKTSIKANLICPRAVNTNFRDKIMPGENKNKLLSTKLVAKKILELASKDFLETGKIFDV